MSEAAEIVAAIERNTKALKLIHQALWEIENSVRRLDLA